MKEDFLHYLWVQKKVPFQNILTTQNETLEILDYGNFLHQEGPDIFNAKIKIDQQIWAGNIEIHVNSSDWYLHNHENDINYNNVILHVVWNHDSAIFNSSNQEIPVLELNGIIDSDLTDKYNQLFSRKDYLNCQKQLESIPVFHYSNWLERLYIERLTEKAEKFQDILLKNNMDWEATFFQLLAKNFGLNQNGNIFLEVASSIPFSVIRKVSQNPLQLEALLFGHLNFFETDCQEAYFQSLKQEWSYLKIKFNLKEIAHLKVKYFKLRPDNFPTIRLSQFASLYTKYANLFSILCAEKSILGIKKILNSEANTFWKNHYNFCKTSKDKSTQLSDKFMDLLLINTILPMKFAYNYSIGKDVIDEVITVIEQIKAERNNITEVFSQVGFNPVNAYQSQAQIQLKNNYCDKKLCLKCAIGLQILKK